MASMEDAHLLEVETKFNKLTSLLENLKRRTDSNVSSDEIVKIKRCCTLLDIVIEGLQDIDNRTIDGTSNERHVHFASTPVFLDHNYATGENSNDHLNDTPQRLEHTGPTHHDDSAANNQADNLMQRLRSNVRLRYRSKSTRYADKKTG